MLVSIQNALRDGTQVLADRGALRPGSPYRQEVDTVADEDLILEQ